MPQKNPTMSRINATEARQHFGKVIQRAYSGNEHLIVEKDNLPVVVVLSFQDYERMRQAAALHNLEEMNRALSRAAKGQGLTPEALDQEVEEGKGRVFEELYG